MRQKRFRLLSVVTTVIIVGIALSWIELARQTRTRERHYRDIAFGHSAAAAAYREKAEQVSRPSLEASLNAAKADLERESVRHLDFRRRLQAAENLSDYRRVIDAQLIDIELDRDETPRRIAQLEKHAAYHEQLKAKYERAAEHPWGEISLDPPAPPVSIPENPPASEDEGNSRSKQ